MNRYSSEERQGQERAKDNLDAKPGLQLISGRRESRKGSWSRWFQAGPHRVLDPLRQGESTFSLLPRDSLACQEAPRSWEDYLSWQWKESQWSQILEIGRLAGVSGIFMTVCFHWYVGDDQYLFNDELNFLLQEALNICGCDSLLPARKDLYLSGVYY